MAPGPLVCQRDFMWAELLGRAAGAGGHREGNSQTQKSCFIEKLLLPGDKKPGDNIDPGHQDQGDLLFQSAGTPSRQSSWCRGGSCLESIPAQRASSLPGDHSCLESIIPAQEHPCLESIPAWRASSLPEDHP